MADRTSLIQIRVSEAEKRQIEVAAKQAGLPVSTWVRMLALAARSETVPPHDPSIKKGPRS